MLSPLLTATVLKMKPSLNSLSANYQNKIAKCMTFENNTRGISAMEIFEKIGYCMEKIDAIRLLSNVLDTALSLLNNTERRVITEVYVNGLTQNEVMLETGLSESKLRNTQKYAFNKMRNYIVFLGFDEKKIMSCFKDERPFLKHLCEVKKNFIQGGQRWTN